MRESGRTWKDVVADALEALGGTAHLRDIAAVARRDPKAAHNDYVDAKVRQIVRQFKRFEPVEAQSGVYRLVVVAPSPALESVAAVAEVETGEPPVLSPPTVAEITSEVQGKLLYIGQASDYETFAPAEDQTKRRFRGRALGEFVTMRDGLADVPRLGVGERKTIAQIDAVWFAETNGELRPSCAFEVEHTTPVQTGLQRLSVIPDLFQTRLFIVGADDAKKRVFDKFLAAAPYKTHASRFRYLYFDEVRDLFETVEGYAAARRDYDARMRLLLGIT